MPTSFKITFNKPAYRTFFEGEDMAGMRIRIDKDTVFFRPVVSVTGDDVVPVSERTRGGVEVVIEGTMADTLLRLLRPRADNPFFLLRRAAKNWIEAVEYTGKSYEPPKYEPHARVWSKETRGAARATEPVRFEQVMDDVRAAKAMVDRYDADRRGGRPPREVNEARALLHLFAETAREVLPFRALAKAHALLGQFLGLGEIGKPDRASVAVTDGLAPEPTAPEAAGPEAVPEIAPESARMVEPAEPAEPVAAMAEPARESAPEPEPAPSPKRSARKPASAAARKVEPEPAPAPEPAPPAQADFLAPEDEPERSIGVHRKRRTLRSRKQEFVVRGHGRRRVLEAV